MRVFLGLSFLFSLAACGGQPAFKEVEPNDTPGQAKSVGAPTLEDPIFIRASIVPANDLDFFPFTVPAFADVKLETFDRSGVDCKGVDTRLQLLDQSGVAILAENDDAAPPKNTCSLIDATNSPGAQRLAPGEYFAKVAAVNETAQIPAYRLQISLLSLCGDGATQGSEQCDDGNVLDGDGCRADCTEELCGDGIVDAGEQCDDQNLLEADACLNNCQAAACGDGVLFVGDEGCDDGNTVNGDGCDDTCRSEFCGDGILDSQEQCDDGNVLDGDGCRADCTEELCGDGIVDLQEQCDDGNVLDGDGCRADCTEELCGDGILDAGEQCDDSNAVNGDGCDDNCQEEISVVVCGDGFVDAGETCDDQNQSNTDACLNSCQLAACGDGFLLTGSEQCDDGNTATGDGCNASCRNEPGHFGELEPNNGTGLFQFKDVGTPTVVIHGAIEPASDLDVFRFTVPLVADVRVQVFDGDPQLASCANVDSAIELIDTDGITILASADEGQESFCSVIDSESDLSAAGLAPGKYFVRIREFGQDEPINHYQIKISFNALCGDGILGGSEQCDDGNVLDGDGCRADCAEELCGDGILDPQEQCDDLNNLNGDGCRADCTEELCGDGIVDAGEQCDDGNTIPEDGCNASCQLEAGQFYEVEPNDVVGSNVKDIPLQEVLVHGAINPIGDVDLYEFRLLASTTIIFETFDVDGPGPQPEGCIGIDTELLLFALDPDTGAMEVALDSLGLPIGDDDSGVLSCSRLSLTLPPNLYQLRVTEFGGDASIAYTMQVTFP